MPITPSTYATNSPITAHQLSQDLYSIDGSYFNSNGVLFHSNRPMLVEAYRQNGLVTAAKGGTFNLLGGAANSAFTVLDTSALFGSGSDNPGQSATFRSQGAVAPSSSGVLGDIGGWGLFISFIPLGQFSGTAGTFGVAWFQGNTPTEPLLDIGCMNPPSNVYNNCNFAVDLLQRTPNTGLIQPGVFAQDPAGEKTPLAVNTVSTVGVTPRFSEIWCGVLNGTGMPVSSVPAPFTAITGLTQISSSTLNTCIGDTFNLLNFPPMLNVESQVTNSISANTVTVVPFTFTPLLDSYSGYSTASTSYTVPLSGIYFCHANIIFASNFDTGQCVAGIQVNGTNYLGGAYNATPNASQNTGASVTKVLDLEAGDVVQVVAVTSAGTSFGSANVSHFILTWMSAIVSGVQHWTPPDVTGFQFLAGTPPESVVNLVANPYFAGGNTADWFGFNGSYTVTSSIPAGAPYQYAAQYVNNGSTAGALEYTNTIPANPGEIYYLSSWVNSTASTIQFGFDFHLNNNFVTTVTNNYTVPSGVWTQLSTSFTAPTSFGINGLIPRIGFPNANGGTLYTQGVIVSADQEALSPLFNQKLANDINFLLNRPYLTVHQTAATGSLLVNANIPVTMQQVGGLVHGSFGDSYNGWNAGSNKYVAPVSGWYLAVSEISAATISTAHSGNSFSAGFSVPTSGGVSAPTSPQAMPDLYQQMMVGQAWTYPTGATAIGTYYLLAGESIAPSARLFSGTAVTWSTDVTHSFDSHFNVIWMSN
jgi:Carbohydrate binding domain